MTVFFFIILSNFLPYTPYAKHIVLFTRNVVNILWVAADGHGVCVCCWWQTKYVWNVLQYLCNWCNKHAIEFIIVVYCIAFKMIENLLCHISQILNALSTIYLSISFLVWNYLFLICNPNIIICVNVRIVVLDVVVWVCFCFCFVCLSGIILVPHSFCGSNLFHGSIPNIFGA